jgi:hypothetical protein
MFAAPPGGAVSGRFPIILVVESEGVSWIPEGSLKIRLLESVFSGERRLVPPPY